MTTMSSSNGPAVAQRSSAKQHLGVGFGKAASRLARLARAMVGAQGTAANVTSFEQLEHRQLLSLEALPASASWTRWGEAMVPAVTNSYIVTFKDYQSDDNARLMTQDVVNALGVTATNISPIGRGMWATFTTQGAITPAMAKRVAQSLPQVQWVEPNQVKKIAAVPNDTEYNTQWYQNNTGQFPPQATNPFPGVEDADIDAEQAWDITIGSRDVIIGVIDTGVDIDHPDLRNNIWTNPGEIAGNGIDDDANGYVDDVNGYDFAMLDNDPREEFDPRGTGENVIPVFAHGTAVAGVIGAVGNNGTGIAGVAWNISILPMKIAQTDGSLSTGAIVAAHAYATMMRERGINLVATNNSYGGYGGAEQFYEDAEENQLGAERAAIQRYLDSGGTFVAAAGNDSFNNDNAFTDPNGITAYPASYSLPGLISVAATNRQDGLAGFSNFGVQTVDLAAPGEDIRTTFFQNGQSTYITTAGTSFAAPVVAGIVGLIKSIKPNASAVEIRELLINTSDPLPGLQGLVRSGGRVNAGRAVRAASIDGPIVQSFSPGPQTTQFDAVTGTALNTLSFTFSEAIAQSTLSASGVTLLGDGADNIFGTGDDVVVPVTSATLASGNQRRVNIGLNLASFPAQRLPVDNYRITLAQAAFRDSQGNRLNGNNVSGQDEVRTFRVVATGADNEPNDTLATATRISFDASGQATLNGAQIGNGPAGVFDIDLYRVDLSTGGQISAQVVAQRLTGGSTLDSFVRLFDANGQELARNDQAFGLDAAVDFFVRTGGAYYIGVSGAGNSTYDPTDATRVGTQSRGSYRLDIAVRLSQDDVLEYNGRSNAIAGQPALPLNIPRGGEPAFPPVSTQGTTTAGISVTDARQVLDVNLSLVAEHTAVGDLQISLIAPNGREVLLMNQRGGTADNLGTFTFSGGNPVATQFLTFDDESATGITSAPTPYVGSYQPENPLGGFDGLSGLGTWTLRIFDAKSTDAGRLIDWNLIIRFQNDIFGPFESNDTLVVSNLVSEVSGTGTATREAFLGDGGFGSFDRDVYRLNVDAGASLTATTTSLGALNSAMRLFDSNGTQILVSNPGDTNSSSFDGFVFPSGGTYYLAVSEASNVAYDPRVAGAGTAALTTGNYRLAINIAPGVSDGSVLLTGQRLRVGLTNQGTFGGTRAGDTALRYDNIEFLTGPTASTFVGASLGGVGFVNAGLVNGEVPFSVNDVSDPSIARGISTAQYRGLAIERSVAFATQATAFGSESRYVAIDITLRNTTGATMTGVSWLEGLNPNQGVGVNEGVAGTANDVTNVGNKVVTATYRNNTFPQGLTVGLAAANNDARAKATVLVPGATFRDSAELVSQPAVDPNGAISDGRLAMTFSVGNLAAGESTTLRYFLVFGNSLSDVTSVVDGPVLTGSGGGLLGTPGSIAQDTLSNGEQVPQYTYRSYYPEGFLGANIFNFVPISNPNNASVNVVLVQRFELNAGQPASQRDRVLGRISVPALGRGGIDVNTPDLFTSTLRNLPVVQAALAAGRGGVPYALELRSDLPIAATFSYYDLTQIPSGPVAVGESFANTTSTSWTFANVDKVGIFGDPNAINTFIILQNPTSGEAKVTITAVNATSGTVYRTTRTIESFGRGGVYINGGGWDIVGTPAEENLILPNGSFGVLVDSDRAIVAARSSYNPGAREATGTIGNVGRGATTGFIAEGQFGLRNEGESIGIYNPSSTSADVRLSFIGIDGSTYRSQQTVPAGQHRVVQVASLQNFNPGQPYSVFFESNTAVSVSATTPIFEDATSVRPAFSDALSVIGSSQAYTSWGFGEGFRPGNNSRWTVNGVANQPHPGLTEALRIYNPNETDTVVEITLNFAGPSGQSVQRRTIPARRMAEFNIEDFIPVNRLADNQAFGIFVKAPNPIVASMNHYDRLFPGAFATLGTPLGRFAQVS
jgi:subtilisin family serine protease/subtilisin-like proprotein convertase family protein